MKFDFYLFISSIIIFVLRHVTGYQLGKITPKHAHPFSFERREYNLIKPYQNANWDIVGTTLVKTDTVILTQNAKSRQGGIWNLRPVESRNWEIVVTVKISGTTGELQGDGMAIWYAKDKGTNTDNKDVFGYKNFFHGLGVFIDTYSNHNGPHNHRHPYISAMVSNGDLKYDHDMDGTHTQLGGEKSGCSNIKLRNKDFDTNLLIRYVNGIVSVYTDVENKGEWVECLSAAADLPTGYFFGVTAATGDLSDNHELTAFRMYPVEVSRAPKLQEVDPSKIVPKAEHYAAPRDHVSDPPPSRLRGLGTTILVIFALVGIAGVLVVGVLVLQKRQENNRKRFY